MILVFSCFYLDLFSLPKLAMIGDLSYLKFYDTPPCLISSAFLNNPSFLKTDKFDFEFGLTCTVYLVPNIGALDTVLVEELGI